MHDYYDRVMAMDPEDSNVLPESQNGFAYAQIEAAQIAKDADAEITRLQAENEALRARVAELQAREDAMCDLSYANGAKQGFSLGQLDDNAGLEQIVAPRMTNGVKQLKHLRTQGAELERQSEGGE
ncbi:hypothetical protein MLC59_01880 [Marinobacter bryozoorum]|uniref:hypothetical protein n=1 Tax=Marinobacter bryozoorum TaxID=256324 RepID=UPI002003DEAF|nr:hypothetical protein [Marinobacter bryozoorum]MCK7542919.1 hypothetical protein [Marinobacter bryozoorum]